MEEQRIALLSEGIAFIEANLRENLDLDQVAAALHYSKYHLHRMFTQTAGLTIHEYVRRRRLTEAARALVFSRQSILDIALSAGYNSQQTFSGAFKELYKSTPARFRQAGSFYPLQLEYALTPPGKSPLTKEDIRLARQEDIPAWMSLTRQVIDGFPHWVETDYRKRLRQSIAYRRAFLLLDGSLAVGAMIFSRRSGHIHFWAVHPQYRDRGLWELFLDKLTGDLLPGRVLSTTTYRAGDKADTGYRQVLLRLGFQADALLTEFGYPTQRFLYLPPNHEQPHP
ncbi:MAG: helix-turn-helix domain-containing protein [Bacillota bacterium]|nr:helix-turn-helix domain-containing protein [Bacillota bacterium]